MKSACDCVDHTRAAPATAGGRLPGRDRIGELDALRGIAAVAVLLFHYTDRFPEMFGAQVMNLPRAHYGYLGVNLFFAISGFVIFMTLQRNGAARDFVRSRFLRLFPAFWTAMLLSFGLLTWLGLPKWSVTPTDLALNLTMLPELWRAVPVDGVYWTLQVELFFYLAMLALSMAGQLANIRWWLFAWVSGKLVAELAAPAIGLHVPYLAGELLILRYIPWFAIGILFYRRWQRQPGAGADLAMVAYSLLAIAATDTPDLAIAGLAVAAAFWALSRGWLAMLGRPVLLYAGTISYPLYLVHQNIGYASMLALQRQGLGPLASMLLTALAMIGLASAICFGVERPLMRRFGRRRAAPTAVEPAGAAPSAN